MIESCKILTWNCNGALRKKFQLLENFDADLTIIQECEDPAQTKDKKYRAWGENHLWVGENKNKGLGIFAKPSIKIHDNHWGDKRNKILYFL